MTPFALNPKPMLVAGVMSGTSADGVDVALVRISPGTDTPRVKLVGHHHSPYPKQVREAVLRAMGTEPTTTADLSRLNWRLGEIYAECLEQACIANATNPSQLQLIGMHGQTIYHQASPARYLAKPVRATWQIGEAAAVAERLRVPVISDFRPADLAAGGQGAPLVPMLDFCLLRSHTKNRVLLNLGGIANVTAIPAGGTLHDVIAFDTGPANMVIDALMNADFGKKYDRNGRIAASAQPLPEVIAKLLKDPWFTQPPPKSCGREQFGAAFVERLRGLCPGVPPAAVVATATELTIASILDAYARFCWPHLGQKAPRARATELIAAGGGVHNAFLMHQLTKRFKALGVPVKTTDAIGIAAQAKESVAFALLAWLTWHGRSGNVPSSTGAARNVVLGKVSFG
jgi:anhydro-N-acetylmuramic acid kinase